MRSFIKETNEGLYDKNGSAITGENSQTMLLGQLKTSDFSTPQKGNSRTNLNKEINNSISHYTTSYTSRNTSNAMSETSSLQPRNKVVNPCLSRNNNDARSILSLPQFKDKSIH